MEKIIDLKSELDFEKFINDNSKCSACEEMDNLLLECSKEFPEAIEFSKIDAEGVPKVSVEYSVATVPTILFFKKSKMVDKRDGFQPVEIKNLIVKYCVEPEPFTEGATEKFANSSNDLNERLKKLINKSRLMLFMKGTPETPKCGFSKQIIQLLKEKNADFSTFDILTDEEVRQGLKKYSDWPTYPQLYLDGELLGGLDIVREELNDPGFLDKLPKIN